MKEYIKNLQTPIVIVGLGKSGHAALNLLKHFNFSSNDLKTFDAKDPLADFNQPLDVIDLKPKTLVVSPGVPLQSDWIQTLKSRGTHITSEISLAVTTLEKEKIIGVTGAVGKSTTVSILGAGVTSFDSNAFVGGNLGIPFCEYALQTLKQVRTRAQWVILELSSYQLENCKNLQLQSSAITYLTANHLERYSSIEEYYLTKLSIAKITLQSCFLNAHGGDNISFSQKHPNVHFKIVSKTDENLQKFSLKKARLIGEHNQDNFAIAAAIALENQWPPSSIESMKSFQGLEHRLENVGLKKGIRFINDSKATALDSVKIAVDAAHSTLENNGKLILLLGGKDKNLPWEELNSFKSLSHTEFIFFGQCGSLAKEKSQLKGSVFPNLKMALEKLQDFVQTNDTVLLSPGGTSLDEFKSFEDRGNYFKKFVESY